MTATETILGNARVVLDDEVVLGSVLVRDGLIADVSPGAEAASGAAVEDFAGDYLFPGIVELHTDHLEGHVMPRPGVKWDPIPAVLSHDAQMAAAGATTVFDAMRVGLMTGDHDASEWAVELAQAIAHAGEEGITRADHFIHIRCEVSAPMAAEQFDAFAHLPIVRLASLMDHTPGQRQYADVEHFKKYMVGKGKVTADGIEPLMQRLREQAEEHSMPNRTAIAGRAQELGITLAAHDDATALHIEESVSFGVAISEFPTTMIAAKAARAAGQLIVMGGPNIVRGGSQSGNIAATDLVKEGLLDILSSDYVPASPLQAVFRLVAEGLVTLPQGARMLSANPARAVGLDDRGTIAPGLRADLVRVHAYERGSAHHPSGVPVPVVRGVWRTGRRVA